MLSESNVRESQREKEMKTVSESSNSVILKITKHCHSGSTIASLKKGQISLKSDKKTITESRVKSKLITSRY